MASEKGGSICRWHQGLDSIPSVFAEGYEPSEQEPLVYHLQGYGEYPDSLVLMEDNNLEFLVAISEHRGREDDVAQTRADFLVLSEQIFEILAAERWREDLYLFNTQAMPLAESMQQLLAEISND